MPAPRDPIARLLKGGAPQVPYCPGPHRCSLVDLSHVRGTGGVGCGRAVGVCLLRSPTGRWGAHEPGLPAGQGATHRECRIALRHNGPGLHPDERAAAAPRAPGPGCAWLPVQPVRASGAPGGAERGGRAARDRNAKGQPSARFPPALVRARIQVLPGIVQEGQRTW